MPIDIYGLPPAAPPPSGDRNRLKDGQPARDAAPAPGMGSATGDTVSLTEAAARLAELERALADVPVVDAQRVEEVKQAIADGRYHVNAARVAEKLMAFESALPAKPKT